MHLTKKAEIIKSNSSINIHDINSKSKKSSNIRYYNSHLNVSVAGKFQKKKKKTKSNREIFIKNFLGVH